MQRVLWEVGQDVDACIFAKAVDAGARGGRVGHEVDRSAGHGGELGRGGRKLESLEFVGWLGWADKCVSICEEGRGLVVVGAAQGHASLIFRMP